MPLTRHAGERLLSILIITLLIQLLFVVYVFYQNYSGRVDLVNAGRTACEKEKLDRAVNAGGWRIAEKARRRDGQIAIANRYNHIATELEQRSRIPCSNVFPSASLLP